MAKAQNGRAVSYLSWGIFNKSPRQQFNNNTRYSRCNTIIYVYNINDKQTSEIYRCRINKIKFDRRCG
ncbi:hypothetical protein PUN28_000889 [Cardiocondyla obscurior]|uniref:Uncharacterized protein n=1 Tax=Cardiocondyla obscurior TaxID=286306 RepID=A0AAW2H1L0_9HYME